MGIEAGIAASLKGRRQIDIAEALGKNQNAISRWKTGATKPSLEEIAKLDEACGRPKGFALRAAGYVDDFSDVVSALEADTRLRDSDRRILIAAYRAAVEGG